MLVHPDHAQAFSRYSDAVHRRGRTFLIVVACVLVSIVVFNFLLIWSLTWGLLGIGAAVVAFGCTLFVWPFVTPETVSLLGAKKGIVIARGASVLIVVIGMWLLWLAVRS
ncbi:MAG TPA: hypothetical protein VF121_07975 [Thermoanaerobaculia bacterium]|nr:hypothetical protein [Thermoanaerobaculia bacterium]